MSQQKRLSYLMFGLLYFAQGTVLSYFTALNAIYFLSKGLTMSDVGIFASIALIPFVIKIFLGMLSDKVNLFGMGYRKPYILIGLAIQALCLIAAPFIDPAGAYWGFVALAFVLQMAMALYDTCTDGLALDTIPEEEQGTIQSFMVGGRALGVVLTASVVGLLAEYVSWVAVFWLLAFFTLLPLPMVLRLREAERPVERAFDWGAFKAFKNRSVIALAGLGFVFFFIIAGANQMVNPFLETEFDIPLSTAGMLTTVWGIGVVLGGATGGWFIHRLGNRNAVRAALVVTFVSVLALALTPNTLLAWPVVALFGLAYGVYQTLYYALAMNYTDPRIAASMFSILMAVTNVAQGVGMAVCGGLADAVGFRWTFAIVTALNVLALPLLPAVFARNRHIAQA
ncbi:MAG TPA: MFS transporter [Anaerolineae bacterium]|nr:MFS transporter [Anaerolineae bacterium]HQI87497.1 MFS transporter [Anaerolineae bacterium]